MDKSRNISKQVEDRLGMFGSLKFYSFPEEIYHYTSLSGLKSIVENGTFWATESRFMNDAGEETYFRQFVDSLLPQMKAVQPSHENIVEKFHNEIMKKLNENDNTEFEWKFILSFSKNKDSLAMWNYYGKNDGYCIGLNGAWLTVSATHINEVGEKDGLYAWAAEVIYDSKKQEDMLIKDFKEIFNLFLELHNTYGEASIPILTGQLLAIWAMYAPYFKHPSFEAEAEFRLVFIEDSMKKFKISHRIYQSIMAPYIEVESENKYLPITSLMIGPMIKHDQALIGLRSWVSKLEIEGFNPDKITKSTIPLRF